MSDFSINFVQFTNKEENKRTENSPDGLETLRFRLIKSTL